jgi:rhodanese-related sulfurtransferase
MSARPQNADSLARLSPLDRLEPSSLAQAASLAKPEAIPRSLHAGAFPWADQVVYLLKGELKLGYPDGRMKVVVGGYGDGLAPLTWGGLDPIDVRAITDADLLCFDEQALDILMVWDQLLPEKPRFWGGGEGENAEWRTMSGLADARRLLQRSFASLPAAHIESLLACFHRHVVRAGEIVVNQGEPGDYYYVIEHGQAQVVREVGGARIELANLKAGDSFGEEALISNGSRNATVIMKTDGELMRLARTDFAKLLREPLLRRIDGQEARMRVADGAQWLDVRFPAEFRHDGLSGAMNIPLNELRDALPDFRKDKEYIVYCRTGRRSSAAAFLLSQHGFQASLLEGGLKTMLQGRQTSVPAEGRLEGKQ